MKKQTSLKVSENPKNCSALKKNLTKLLELFEIARKSADVAHAKGHSLLTHRIPQQLNNY